MSDIERYSRQVLFEGIGEDGQRRLCRGRVVLAGCGALGSVSASLLVRAGVGYLRIIDRDFIELSNLQRQMLFDEEDVHAGLPKAEAARRKLACVNSDVRIDAHVRDLAAHNARELLAGCDLIIDATDNFETRYLINDFAVNSGTPWIYVAAVAAEGRTMTVLPGETPCLRCIFGDPPPPGSSPTCETAGIIGPAASVIASLAVTEALKLLSGHTDALRRGVLSVNVWEGTFRTAFAGPEARKRDCPTCGLHRFEFLEGKLGLAGVKLCGRDAVHVSPGPRGDVDLKDLAGRLKAQTIVLRSDFLLRFEADGKEVTVFPDGRAIIKGTSDPAVARGIYARYIGS